MEEARKDRDRLDWHAKAARVRRAEIERLREERDALRAQVRELIQTKGAYKEKK